MSPVSEPTAITCKRCGADNPPLLKAPFANPLGNRILTEVCQPCWQQWLQAQTRLMNHYGLDTMNPEHRKFIIENLKAFLFNEGGLAAIDTSLEGTITHIKP
jgi:Fe-S cluster biosynthesis and repair protein YggX